MLAQELAVDVDVVGGRRRATTPRYTLRLPIMCTTTKPIADDAGDRHHVLLADRGRVEVERGTACDGAASLAAVPVTGPRVTTCATTQTLTPRRSGHEVDERLDGADELGPQVGVGPHAVAQPGPEAVEVGAEARQTPSFHGVPHGTSGQASSPSTDGRMPAQTSTNGWPVMSTSGPATAAARRGSLDPARGGRRGRRAAGAGPGRTPRPPPAGRRCRASVRRRCRARGGRRPTRARAARRRGGPRPRSGWPPRRAPRRSARRPSPRR